MYLSYSGYKTYDSCPRSYWHRYVNKTLVTKPDNRVHMLYGEAVGLIFEEFYVRKIWREPSPTEALVARVDETLAGIVKKETARGGVFDWDEKDARGKPALKPGTRSLEEVRGEVIEAIPRGVASIKLHRLLGVKSGAEVKLDTDIKGHRLAGRADFIIHRVSPDEDKILIDGKGSRWRDKYVDRRQLKWYAMLYQKKFGVLPDRLGFLYWRSEPEDSLDWVACTPRDIEIMQETVLESVSTIEDGARQLGRTPGNATLVATFPVKPGPDCKLCSYLEICDEGADFLQKKVPKLEDTGVGDVGLG